MAESRQKLHTLILQGYCLPNFYTMCGVVIAVKRVHLHGDITICFGTSHQKVKVVNFDVSKINSIPI